MTTDEQTCKAHIERQIGKPIHALTPVTGGYSHAWRRIVRFADGTSAFAKMATDDLTTDWLKTEARVYAALGESRFLPKFERFAHDPALLVIEDLSATFWPPPWTTSRVNAVQQALHEVRAAAPRVMSAALPRVTEKRNDFALWQRVAETPEEFLSLNLCSRDWLKRALPDLIAAERAAPLDGDDLLHLDVRSDNLCFRSDGGAVLVDWNWACIGNGDLDVACWLPSLAAEGGPLPETILPGAAEFAALLSGFFAFQAGMPPPPTAPRVRIVQRQQLSAALPWAIRALNLPPLDA